MFNKHKIPLSKWGDQLESSMTPIFWWKYSNLIFDNNLVKISVFYSLEGMEINWTTLFVTFSLRKWYFIWMWLDLECKTQFLDTLMALVLSQWMGMGSVYFTSKSTRVWIIHSTCVQQVAAAMYSALVVDKDIEPYFLLIHATNESPKKNAPPLVLFLSCRQFS